mmetsp:Transcript_52229/g.135423  ORF Transcript_52229/g.135423 Transcript_52229/m.135423 type:complete len:205 (+) Transcript_52229:163-777(+)
MQTLYNERKRLVEDGPTACHCQHTPATEVRGDSFNRCGSHPSNDDPCANEMMAVAGSCHLPRRNLQIPRRSLQEAQLDIVGVRANGDVSGQYLATGRLAGGILFQPSKRDDACRLEHRTRVEEGVLHGGEYVGLVYKEDIVDKLIAHAEHLGTELTDEDAGSSLVTRTLLVSHAVAAQQRARQHIGILGLDCDDLRVRRGVLDR